MGGNICKLCIYCLGLWGFTQDVLAYIPTHCCVLLVFFRYEFGGLRSEVLINGGVLLSCCLLINGGVLFLHAKIQFPQHHLFEEILLSLGSEFNLLVKN